MLYQTLLSSPLGPITLTADESNLLTLKFGDFGGGVSSPLLDEAGRQLGLYFSGDLKVFDLPLSPMGTEFQKKVWAALCTIPYGGTITYKALATACESPRAFRAVGQANRRNPLPIIIPCHRVIASDGGIGGYLGVWGDVKSPKSWLLEHERLKKA